VTDIQLVLIFCIGATWVVGIILGLHIDALKSQIKSMQGRIDRLERKIKP